jgi:hypothetical protein
MLRRNCLQPFLAVGVAVVSFVQTASGDRPNDFFTSRLSTSPDPKYWVEFAETAKHELVYRWMQQNPRRVLVEIKSTYQLDYDAEGHSGRDKFAFARDVAGISWSADSRLLAIDEAVLRMSGTVLLSLRSNSDQARQISIPEWKIREASGQHWARARMWLRRDGELIRNGDVKLSLIGWVYDKTRPHPETEQQLHYGCQVTLHLGPGHGASSEPAFSIEPCRELTE